MICRIWFTIDSRDPYYLRRIVLRIFWDDEATPSVEAPIGDFFGNGFNYRPYISEYLGMTSGGFICYFPMPFEEHAKIEIANETMQEVYAFYYQIDYQKFEGALDRDLGYFHALWKRDIRTDYDSNYVILNATGQGHIVGVNMNIQSYNGTLSYLKEMRMYSWIMRRDLPFTGPGQRITFQEDGILKMANFTVHITVLYLKMIH